MKKHILSVLVENHSGVLSRIAGLFSRRGYNINSLSVGETTDPKTSRMTIVVEADDAIMSQIKNQLNKQVSVRKIIELEYQKSIIRNLVLIKVKTSEKTRPYIIEIADIFKAKIVDVATDSIILEVTGNEDKISALIALLTPYKIKELVQTGVCSLERGDILLDTHKKYEEN
jgi:acetolactate synthase I/III small subunit